MDCIVDDGIREFPKTLVCVVQEGFIVKNDYVLIKGFGNKSIVAKDKVLVAIQVNLETNVDLSMFTYWFYNEINRGELDFIINIPIFGTLKDWTCKVYESNLEADGEGNISLDLEVVGFTATEEMLCNFTEGVCI